MFVIKGSICKTAFRGQNCSFKAVKHVCERKLNFLINSVIMSTLPMA